MWEEGEVTLGTSFTERFGRGEPGGSTTVRREERESKEKRKKDSSRIGIWTRMSASLTLYCVTRVHTDVVCSSNPNKSIGCHHS
jgi:hypothetical protein